MGRGARDDSAFSVLSGARCVAVGVTRGPERGLCCDKDDALAVVRGPLSVRVRLGAGRDAPVCFRFEGD